jgi:hypothetical protein
MAIYRSAERLPMNDPMQTMKSCRNHCEEVPDEVTDAVFDALDEIPGESEDSREARANAVAARMAREGWRFCVCFAEKRTPLHRRVFDLVHTNMANRLAHRLLLTGLNEPSEGRILASAR